MEMKRLPVVIMQTFTVQVMSDDSGYHYVKCDGADFFPDGIDYDNARNLDVDLRKQTIG